MKKNDDFDAKPASSGQKRWKKTSRAGKREDGEKKRTIVVHGAFPFCTNSRDC